VVGCVVGGVSSVRIGVAREPSGCSTRFKRGSASRRPQVLADRIACPGDRSGVFGLLGDYWGADLGLTIRAW
jgi:hypothetical protein